MITAELIEQISEDAYTNTLDLAIKGGCSWNELPEWAKERTRVMVRDVLIAYFKYQSRMLNTMTAEGLG